MRRVTRWIQVACIFFGALSSSHLRAQSVGEPHVRWVTGGTVLGANLVAFSADSARLFTHSATDIGLKEWDLASRQLLSVTRIPASRTGTAGLSPDQQSVAFYSTYDSAFSVCRVGDGAVLWSTNMILPFAPYFSFATDDSLLLAYNLGGLYGYPDSALVFHVANGEFMPLSFVNASGTKTNAFGWAEFVTDSEFIALQDGEADRFNAVTGDAVWRHPDPSVVLTRAVALSPDRTEFCAFTTNGVRRYSTITGLPIPEMNAPQTNATVLAYSPDGTTLAVAISGIGVELRSLTNGVLLRLLTGLPEEEFELNSLAWSPDRQHLAAGGTYGGYLWSLAGGDTSEPLFPLVRSQRSRALFSFDHQWLAKSSWPNEMDLLNPTNGVVAHRWQLGPEAAVDNLQPSPATNMVFVPTSDGQVQIYSLTNGTLLSTQSLLPDAGWGQEFTFSADGSRLLVMDPNGGLNGQAAVFSTLNWQLLRRVDVSGALRSLITPDGNRFIVASLGESTRVWNVGDTDDPIVIPAGGFLEFGTMSNELWTLGKDGWVDHWQLSDGTLLGGVKIAETNYTGMLSPDKRLILTSKRDEPLKLWRSDTGELVGQLAGPRVAAFSYFSASPDGRWLVGTRQDGSLVAFDFPVLLMDPRIVGGEFHLGAAGATGPFQLESRTPDNATWEPVGAPFEGETKVPLSTETARYFRAGRAN